MSEMGICINEAIMGHLLLVDDLILFSDTITVLQKHFYGVIKFYSHSRMIVNESETKLMQSEKRKDLEEYFNGTQVNEVLDYKYLGIIIRPIQQANPNLFVTIRTSVIKPSFVQKWPQQVSSL